MKYLLTIWLEVHLKIKAPNKLFCQCKNEQNFDVLMPNTNICPVCTAQPGALPTLSAEPLWKALLLGKILNCKIQKKSSFDRKSYFYPDLPMGYQITQLYHPTNVDGSVSFFVDDDYKEERTVGIRDAHIENDTAKMIHDSGQALIDFNRAGTPLVEIVTQPDFVSGSEVTAFLKELQRRAKYNGISDADMDKWQMRIDVNISVRQSLDDPYGTRVELKNINSFGMVRRAIQHEYDRQVSILENGESFRQETRSWDDQKWESFAMRSKEDALDYRYFPEPDLPELVLDDLLLQKVMDADVEIPHQIIKELSQKYGFHKEYINVLISDKMVLDYFLDILSSDSGFEPKNIVKWIAGPISAYLKENFVDIDKLEFDKNEFIEFLKIVEKWNILDNQLKQVMDEMLKSWSPVGEIVAKKWFDGKWYTEEELTKIVDDILQNSPNVVEQYREWKTSTMWFFVWQVMKNTQWKANPKIVQKIILSLI